MQYEFKGKSLHSAISKAVRKTSFQCKETASGSVESGSAGNYKVLEMDLEIEKGQTYTVSWTTAATSSDNDYGIKIAVAPDQQGPSTAVASNGDGDWQFSLGEWYGKTKVIFEVTYVYPILTFWNKPSFDVTVA